MALRPGSRVGSYEVLELVGTGGMGEVYRSRDVRLRRTVALKTLGAKLEGNPQARARFKREARAVAALNHPNICDIHDVGEWEGQDFLVMEFVEGETLQHRLLRGPLPVEELLHIGFQIASALVAAHRSGIVHRDLKPANVMLTRDNLVKLLDFGIARHALSPDSASDATLTATSLGADGNSPARCRTWLRSNSKAVRSIRGRTSSRLALSSSRWRLDDGHSKVRHRPPSSRRSWGTFALVCRPLARRCRGPSSVSYQRAWRETRTTAGRPALTFFVS